MVFDVKIVIIDVIILTQKLIIDILKHFVKEKKIRFFLIEEGD